LPSTQTHAWLSSVIPVITYDPRRTLTGVYVLLNIMQERQEHSSHT
jgi:hypothetical protein